MQGGALDTHLFRVREGVRHSPRLLDTPAHHEEVCSEGGRVFGLSARGVVVENPFSVWRGLEISLHQLGGFRNREGMSYLRPIRSCITQPKGHGPSRTCNDSKEEEAEAGMGVAWGYNPHTVGLQMYTRRRERILLELMTSDDKLKASREGSN